VEYGERLAGRREEKNTKEERREIDFNQGREKALCFPKFKQGELARWGNHTSGGGKVRPHSEGIVKEKRKSGGGLKN